MRRWPCSGEHAGRPPPPFTLGALRLREAGPTSLDLLLLASLVSPLATDGGTGLSRGHQGGHPLGVRARRPPSLGSPGPRGGGGCPCISVALQRAHPTGQEEARRPGGGQAGTGGGWLVQAGGPLPCGTGHLLGFPGGDTAPGVPTVSPSPIVTMRPRRTRPAQDSRTADPGGTDSRLYASVREARVHSRNSSREEQCQQGEVWHRGRVIRGARPAPCPRAPSGPRGAWAAHSRKPPTPHKGPSRTLVQTLTAPRLT